MHRFGHVAFNANFAGRDIVVGDIHGCFGQLEKALSMVEFDPSKDRLFSVGDLVDRGPDSLQALNWLNKPWFRSVLGNHELWQLISRADIKLSLSGAFDYFCGPEAAWSETVDSVRLGQLLYKILELPLAITIQSSIGPIGLVHAALPNQFTFWTDFVRAIQEKSLRETDFYQALWERRNLQRDIESTSTSKNRVTDVAALFHGHSIPDGRKPFSVANCYHIETGAFLRHYGAQEGGFTLVDINKPDRPLLSGWWPN